MAEKHYTAVNTTWPDDTPPITRVEAERAAKRIARHFGFQAGRVRRCWVAQSAPFNTLNRGWRRLVHDLSHRWFRQVYPKKQPHDPLHARYEADVTAFVLQSGWLGGKLKPAPAPKNDV